MDAFIQWLYNNDVQPEHLYTLIKCCIAVGAVALGIVLTCTKKGD